jgi:hypothetical protein
LNHTTRPRSPCWRSAPSQQPCWARCRPGRTIDDGAGGADRCRLGLWLTSIRPRAGSPPDRGGEGGRGRAVMDRAADDTLPRNRSVPRSSFSGARSERPHGTPSRVCFVGRSGRCALFVGNRRPWCATIRPHISQDGCGYRCSGREHAGVLCRAGWS